MPVMWRDLAGWNAAKLAGIADALIKDRNTLVGMQEHVESAAAPKGFVGKHADAAAEQLRRYTQHLEVRVAQQAAVATAFDRALDVAIAHDDGRVIFVGDDDEIVPGSERDEAAARVKAEAQDQVDEVMRLANEVDTNLSNTMHWAAIGWIDDDGATNLEDAAEAGEDEALDIAHHNLLGKYQVATDPTA